MASCVTSMAAVFAVVLLTGAMLVLVVRDNTARPEKKKKPAAPKKVYHMKHKQGPRAQLAQPSNIPEAYAKDEYAPL